MLIGVDSSSLGEVNIKIAGRKKTPRNILCRVPI